MTSVRFDLAVVDDDPYHRSGVANAAATHPRVRRVELVSHPSDVSRAPDDAPRVIILDLILDPEREETSIGWIERLVADGSIVVVHSQSSAPLLVQGAMASGARTFVHKREGNQRLLEAVVHAVDGVSHPISDVAAAILQREVPLNDTERKILAHVRAGLDNEQIAQRLHLSVKTVANNISTAIVKFRDAGRDLKGLKPRVDLSEAAREQGITRPEELDK